jgi:hypothetical protein
VYELVAFFSVAAHFAIVLEARDMGSVTKWFVNAGLAYNEEYK